MDDCGGLSKGRDSAPVQPGVFADAAGADESRSERLISYNSFSTISEKIFPIVGEIFFR